MGASGWTYYVPYQEDIEEALQTLRQQVFASGEYVQLWRLFDEANDDLRGYVDFWGEEIQVLPPPPPQTIEEVLQRSQGQGTHSILDIDHVSPYSRYYEVIPIAEEILMQFFQDQKPTREVVEAIVTYEAIWSALCAWIDLYVQCRTSEPKQHTIFKFPEEVINLVSEQRPQHELVEEFVTHEELWLGIYCCLRSVIKLQAVKAMSETALPFPTEELMQLFGTKKPTKEMVIARFGGGDITFKTMCRNIGYYAVLYQNDIPHEIVFAGFSGD